MYKIWLVLLLVFFTIGTSFSEMSVQEWEDLFITQTDVEYFLNEERSLSSDSWQQYSLSRNIDAHIAMFRATEKLEYLDRALFYINNLMETAAVSSSLPRSQFKDAYLGWANHSHPELGDDGREYPLFESICWKYVAHLLRVMKKAPDVYNDADYKEQYDRILLFLEKHIYEKWHTRGVANLYRSRTHMASHWAYLSLELWIITENSKYKPIYKEIFENINSGGLPNYEGASLRSQLITVEDGNPHYFWASVWNSTERPGQDTAHGNNVLAYIVEAHDLGIEWTDQDISYFKNTFNDIIWPDSDHWARYVDGSGDGGHFISDGFLKLGRYDKNLQERLETSYIPTHKNLQIYGNAALNAKIMQETTFTTSCSADIEPDGDVDGADLSDFAAYFDSDGLAEFAGAYGSENAGSALLIDEPFLDLDLKARGWSRPTSCITMAYDQHLGRDVGQSEFVAEKSRAVSGAMGAYFYFPEALDEFTVIFKEKVIGSDVLGNQIIHGMYALPESDDGTLPQRSRGTLYFDPSKSQDLEPGSWVLAFQDTVSMSCPEGNIDLYGVSEDRSVGGCQQDYQQQERVRRFCSSDYCQDPEHAQSGWTLFPTTNAVEYPIEHNEWATFVYYVKLNTPGKFDGIATLHVKREDDSTFTQTINADKLMFRAAGWNKNLKIGKFLFGPFASANIYTFKVRWADLKFYSGDARKICLQQ